jgi:hypothetical protein
MQTGEVRITGKFAKIAVMALIFSMVGCGGGTPKSTLQPPPPPPASMQGAWIFLFHSAVSNGCFALEANLSQTGNHVSADKTSSIVFQPLTCTHSTIELQLNQLGGQCNGGGMDDITVDATASDIAVSFTLSETGGLGSAVTTVSASTDGTSISKGTYSTPAACGLPDDHGTVEGYQDSITFSGEHYAGTFNGGTDAIVAQFTTSNFHMTMSGTDNGTSFVLSGSTVGLSLYLTGTIAGVEVNWFGIYDPLYNNFNIYNSDSTYVGSLANTP